MSSVFEGVSQIQIAKTKFVYMTLIIEIYSRFYYLPTLTLPVHHLLITLGYLNFIFFKKVLILLLGMPMTSQCGVY